MPVSPRLLRDTMGGFATGVAVVTTNADGQLHGMTVNSLTSVSLDPPMLLVCLTKDSRTADAVERRRAFVVNLLGHDQQDLSDRFARRGTDHFEHIDVRLDEHGLPVLGHGLGHVVCSVAELVDGGDHTIVVGDVVACESRDADPLLFFRGRYNKLTAPEREAQIDWYW